MKNILGILLALLMLTSILCSCEDLKNEDDFSIPTLTIPEEYSQVSEVSEEPVSTVITEYKDHGVPLKERYPDDTDTARNVWDLAVLDGYLYVGCGDFDTNAGPCDVWRMDTSTGEWQLSGTVNDEQINRFEMIGGSLVIPGTDPKGNWSHGSHYQHNGTEWQEIRTIPGGVHVFDMMMFDGKIFAGLGALGADSAAAVSLDGGESFSPVSFVRDGKPFDVSDHTINRVYDLFEVNGTLYALYCNDTETNLIFRYNGREFEYDCSWRYKLISTGLWYVPIGDKTLYGTEQYIAAGYLYRVSEKAEDITFVQIPDVERVWDVLTYDGVMYVLGDRLTAKGYETVVVSTTDGSEFEDVARLLTGVPARSFAFDGNSFFFGLGNFEDTGADSGRIISAEVIK